jgi:hypothetical protein
MLELSHPFSKHIFHASGLLGGVLKRGQQMSLAPSAIREELLAECLPLFNEMRELNAQHFGASGFIAQAIEECASGIRQLAAGTHLSPRRPTSCAPSSASVRIDESCFGLLLPGASERSQREQDEYWRQKSPLGEPLRHGPCQHRANKECGPNPGQ